MSGDSTLTGAMSLSASVEHALQADPMTSGHPLSVAAEGALITLAGRVPRQEIKDAAIRTARGVAGVVDVVDDVTVGDDDGGLFGGRRRRRRRRRRGGSAGAAAPGRCGRRGIGLGWGQRQRGAKRRCARRRGGDRGRCGPSCAGRRRPWRPARRRLDRDGRLGRLIVTVYPCRRDYRAHGRAR